jgi:oxalate decarboxylase/phosphoglucose isomerase-like protein (cupin superfamily)
MTRTVEKPWGHELIWAVTDRYVGKILHIKAGQSLSLQYHVKKDETVMVLRGKMAFTHYQEGAEPTVTELGPLVPFHVTPGLRSTTWCAWKIATDEKEPARPRGEAGLEPS